MAVDFKKFDEKFDIEGLNEDAKNANEQGDFPEIPDGSYEVKITKLELGESKKGDPMLICWMEIVAGEYKKQKLFYYQVIGKGFGLHKANVFLRSLDTGYKVELKTFSAYADLILDIAEKIEDDKLEYLMKVETKKGFQTFEVSQVYAD